MTESATRKRAALFMRELGTADAAAGLPPRESEDLRAQLVITVAMAAPGDRWQRYTSALNAYHPAHRRAKRDGGAFETMVTTDSIACRKCMGAVIHRDAALIANHVGSIAHLARAEGAAAKARAT